MSQFYIAFGGSSGSVTSITGISPIQANGVSGVPQTGAVSVSIIEASPSYTNVTFVMSPYTVLSTDYYLSVDTSGGPITLNFPNSPTSLQEWIVKDRLGDANVNFITITTPGGTKTFDGEISYTIDDMFESVQILANPSGNYEFF